MLSLAPRRGGDGTSKKAAALLGANLETNTFTYYLGSPEWTYTPQVVHSQESCQMTCSLTEDGQAADMDVITKFDEKTGRFSLFTDDAFIYERENLKMQVTCRNEMNDSEIVDDVTI